MASLLRKWHSEILLLSRLHYPISLFVSFAPLVCAYSPFDRQAVWVPANLFDVFPAVWVTLFPPRRACHPCIFLSFAVRLSGMDIGNTLYYLVENARAPRGRQCFVLQNWQ